MNLTEGGVRVPYTVRWPGRVPRGSVCHEPVITMDWTATMLAAAGVCAHPDHPLDGLSLLELLTQPPRPQPTRPLFWRVKCRDQAAMREGPWKYLRIGPYEYLFDLSPRLLALWPLPSDLPPREDAEFCLALASTRGGAPREEVLQAARRAVDLLRTLGDRGRLADALLRIGVIGISRGDVPEADAAIAEAAVLIEPDAPNRQRASLAMVQGSGALARRHFADAADAFRRQAELYREDASEFGEYLALLNLSSVSLDIGNIDEAIKALGCAIAGLRRIRAPYGLGSAGALMAIARAVRGDDDDSLAGAREAYETPLPNGASSLDKPLMTAAMFHTRHGDLQRAAVIAGCANGPNVRGKNLCCPIDDRQQR